MSTRMLVLVFRDEYTRTLGTAWVLQVVAVAVLLAGYELGMRCLVRRSRSLTAITAW